MSQKTIAGGHSSVSGICVLVFMQSAEMERFKRIIVQSDCRTCACIHEDGRGRSVSYRATDKLPSVPTTYDIIFPETNLSPLKDVSIGHGRTLASLSECDHDSDASA